MSQFNLSCITLAYKTANDAESALDSLTAEMMCWHEAGEYPKPAAVIVAITEGVPHLSKATIKTYASGLLAWAKSGKTPRTMRELSLNRPVGHVKGKGGRPSKAQAQDKATATPSAPAANDAQINPRETAIAALQNIMAIRTKLGVPMGSQFTEFEDHLAAMIAILRSIKVAQTPGPDAVKA